MVQIVALARALSDAGEDAVAAMPFSDIIDKLLDDNGLAHAGAAESADLTASHEGADQVDDLDAGLENLDGGGLIFQVGRLAVNRVARGVRHWLFEIDGLAEHVEDTPERLGADGDRNRFAGVVGIHAALQAIGWPHCHAAYPVVAQVLLNFKREIVVRSRGAYQH